MSSSFRTENRLESHEKVCKNKDFCGIVMPSGKDNILYFKQHVKSDKMSYIIYTDIKSLRISIVYSKCGHENEKKFKEEESIEILKVLGLINNIEEYQKIYNHTWRNYKPTI